MKEKILASLKRLNIEEYIINIMSYKSAQMFFVKKSLDCKRAENTISYNVNVYRSFEKDGKTMKGNSSVYVYNGMTEEEIDALYEAIETNVRYYGSAADETGKTVYVVMDDEDVYKLYPENLHTDAVLRFYQYGSGRNLLLTIEIIEDYDADGNPISDAIRGQGKFYVLASPLGDMETYAEYLVSGKLCPTVY